MQSDHHSPAHRDLLPAVGVAFLSITLQQLRVWEEKARRQVIVPKADAEAWEETEIDVRRTSL